jgi:hypothetical protein
VSQAARQPALAAVILLILGGLLLVAPPSSALAAGQLATRAARPLQAIPPAQPPLAHWSDPTNGTAYAVLLQAGATPLPASGGDKANPRGEFGFTLADGSILHGAVPITGPNSGNYDVQDTTTGPAAANGVLCQPGELTLPSAPTTPATGTQPTATHPVDFILRAHFDNDGLVAYAHISYAQINSRADAPYIGLLCKQGADSPHVADLVSGCQTYTAPCSTPLETAVSTVSAFDDAVLHGVNTGDWSSAYSHSTESIRAQYTTDEYAAAIRAQFGSAGKITAISPVTTSPQLLTGTVGEPYFVVKQTATVALGGKTYTRTITSWYLLEQGNWYFWFSA